MKMRINVAWISILLWAWSCHPTGASGQASSEANNPSERVSLTLEKRSLPEDESMDAKPQNPTSEDRGQIVVRLINRSGQTLWFTGYNEGQPWYQIQRLVNGRWQDHLMGWFCGTGLRRCEIPTGKSSVMTLSPDKGLYPLRIGISYGLGTSEGADQIVWSELIDSR